MRSRQILLSFVVVLLLLIGISAFGASGTVTCGNVTTASTSVLASNGDRLSWSIWTTSGAATIYFAEGVPATTGGVNSAPLMGGQSYTQERGAAYTGAINASAKSGTVWVCVQESK